MIFTHRIADDTGRFPVRLVVVQMELAHIIENSALYRLLNRPWHPGSLVR